jgi:RNA polymerase sigma-70 factor (ECF subfamily)
MLAGEEAAFDEFFEGSFPGLYRFALVRLGYDEDAAEEVAQATLCAAITRIATYRGEAALFTWLCTFCRHEISAYYRKTRRTAAQVELAEDDPEVAAALQTLSFLEEGPEDTLRRAEVARLVHVALDSLPGRYADALEWKYVDGLPVSEIAERLRVSAKAAESLLTRAREAFREAFSTLLRRQAPDPAPPQGS